MSDSNGIRNSERRLSSSSMLSATWEHASIRDEIVNTTTAMHHTNGDVREQEPLLEPQLNQESDEARRQLSLPSSGREAWGEAEQTKSVLYLILLTISLGGLQVAWCVELSNISPFLLSLGLSKSLLALVWIAGPLGGTIVQPYIGIKSDNCRIRWGRRRPFIILGAITTMVSLLALAWTREIVGAFAKMFASKADPQATAVACQVFAVVFVYILDFMINISPIRPLMVDCAPTHQQEDVNAWANRMTGIGNILGYLAGFVKLPEIFPWLGNTQFKGLVTFTCIAMSATFSLSCATIHEQDPSCFGPPSPDGDGLLAFFRSMYRSIRTLPAPIRSVCAVQLANWIAWFPFLFYITTYVGGIYAEPYFRENPNMSAGDVEKVWARGTRFGTLALFIFAITTFIASVIIPLLVVPTFEAGGERGKPSRDALESGLSTRQDFHSSVAPPLLATRNTIWERLQPLNKLSRNWSLKSLQIPDLTLRRVWLFNHIFFAILMWLTLLVTNTLTATVLVSLVGIPWAVTTWVPFALISGEISRRDAIRRGLRAPQDNETSIDVVAAIHGSSNGTVNERESQESIREGSVGIPSTADVLDDPSTDQAGVILGIHNISIAAPQVIATVVSSAIFRALQKPRGTPGDDSVGWVLRFGGCCALAAAYLCSKLRHHIE